MDGFMYIQVIVNAEFPDTCTQQLIIIKTYTSIMCIMRYVAG